MTTGLCPDHVPWLLVTPQQGTLSRMGPSCQGWVQSHQGKVPDDRDLLRDPHVTVLVTQGKHTQPCRLPRMHTQRLTHTSGPCTAAPAWGAQLAARRGCCITQRSRADSQPHRNRAPLFLHQDPMCQDT